MLPSRNDTISRGRRPNWRAQHHPAGSAESLSGPASDSTSARAPARIAARGSWKPDGALVQVQLLPSRPASGRTTPIARSYTATLTRNSPKQQLLCRPRLRAEGAVRPRARRDLSVELEQPVHDLAPAVRYRTAATRTPRRPPR